MTEFLGQVSEKFEKAKILATSIVNKLYPEKNPEYCCMLYTAAFTGVYGKKYSDIKIGAIFYPSFYEKLDDFALSVRGGWGLEGYDPQTGQIWLSEESVDDDGGFRGHTWIEEKNKIFDPMHNMELMNKINKDKDEKIICAYIRRTLLETKVKKFWEEEMKNCYDEGKRLFELEQRNIVKKKGSPSSMVDDRRPMF